MSTFVLGFDPHKNILLSERVYQYLSKYCYSPQFRTEFKRRSHLYGVLSEKTHLRVNKKTLHKMKQSQLSWYRKITKVGIV
jgi:hypothetical protein